MKERSTYRSTWKTASKLGDDGEAFAGRFLRHLFEDGDIYLAQFATSYDGSYTVNVELGRGINVERSRQENRYLPERRSGVANSDKSWFVASLGDGLMAVPLADVRTAAIDILNADPSRGLQDHCLDSDEVRLVVAMTADELRRAGGERVPQARSEDLEWIAPYKPENQDTTTSDFDLGIPFSPVAIGETPAAAVIRHLASRSGGNRLVLEVKTDDKWAETGNYFSETKREIWQGGGKLENTGILVSESPWYVMPLGRAIQFVPTAELKELTLSKKQLRGGDGKRSRGSLIKVDELLTVGQGHTPAGILEHLLNPMLANTEPEPAENAYEDVDHGELPPITDQDLDELLGAMD